MAVIYHVNPATNRPNICRAGKKPCPFKHFDNKQEAKEYSEGKLAEDSNVLGSSKKQENIEQEPKEKVRYSFVEEFQKEEEKFEHDYDGIPTRFYNADLNGGHLAILKNVEGMTEEEIVDSGWTIVDHKKLLGRLYQSTSTPKDNEVPDNVLLDNLESLGFKRENVYAISDERLLRSFGATRGFLHKDYDKEGKPVQTIIVDGKSGKSLYKYNLLSKPNEEFMESRSVTKVDFRSVMGAARTQRLTGISTLKGHVSDSYSSWRGLNTPQKASILASYMVLREKQEEGKDFKTRQKYVKDSNAKVATVWMDKKNQKESHIEAAKNSSLRGTFSEVEIDNDVDLKEFEQFERDYNEIKDKLPPIPEDRKPRIGIRKLGKHSGKNFEVSGLYSPGLNSIAISVNNSGSTIHEMAHMYDFAVKGNPSMKSDFKEIQQSYAKNLKLPAGMENKGEYYSSSHEVFARGFEMYAHEKLGIKNNKLLNEEKFDGFDYEPIRENPELKEKMFAFYDSKFSQANK